MTWEVREDRQYTTRVHIDDVDVSDKLTDLKINFDLSGSSSSSIFGSVLVYNLDLEFIENVKGDTLHVEFGYYVGEYMDEPTYDYKDFGYFKITDSSYDEKSDSTKVTAQTNLDPLNEKFSLQDLTDNPVENLIPNGWDSFEPYGNEGEETRAPLEVFEEGYNRNLLLNTSLTMKEVTTLPTTFFYQKGSNIKLKLGDVLTISVETKGVRGSLEFGVSRVANSFQKDMVGYNVGLVENGKTTRTITIRESDLYETGDTYLAIRVRPLVNTLPLTYFVGSEKIEKGSTATYWTPAWEDIPEEDKPVRAWDNMAVHLTPLGNGLTRIQTWGGRDTIKLVHPMTLNLNETTFITYIENNDVSKMRISRNNPYMSEIIDKNTNKNVIFTNTDVEGRGSNYHIATTEINEKLDFIASEPMIYDLEGVNTTNSIITQSLRDNESVVSPSVDLPLGTIGDKFYERRLELFKDIASLTRTYLEINYNKNDITYVFKEIDEPEVSLPVFELDHEDTLSPIDTVDLRYSYGDNVAMGTGKTVLALNDIELVRDQKEDVVPFLYGLYKGFTYTQLKFTSPSHMFIGNQVTLNSVDGPVVALITKGEFDAVQWVGTYESEIIDQEEVHTNYVGTYDRVLKDTSIKVDKVEGSIDIIVAEQQEIGDEISRQSGEIALLKDGLTVEIAERVTQGDQIIDYVGTMLDVSLDGIRIEVENTKTQVEDIDGNLRDMQMYFDFRDDGLGLGRRDSPYKAQIDNESLSFTENGNVNTEISRQRLLTNRVEVKESLVIANTKIELSPYDSSRVIWRVV